VGSWFSKPSAGLTEGGAEPVAVRSGVGKYIKTAMAGDRAAAEEEPAAKKAKAAGGSFSNFDGW
jgi:hypothetical protein